MHALHPRVEVVPLYKNAAKFTKHIAFLFSDFESVHQANIWLSAAILSKSEMIFSSLDGHFINTMNIR